MESRSLHHIAIISPQSIFIQRRLNAFVIPLHFLHLFDSPLYVIPSCWQSLGCWMTDHRSCSSEDNLTAVLDVLLYEDGKRRPLTKKTLDYIDTIIPTLDESHALLIDGILQFGIIPNAHRLLSKAEAGGCVHPLLYYYLGKCFCDPLQKTKRMRNHATRSIEYYMKAIAGTFISSCSPYSDLILDISCVYLTFTS